VDNEITKKYIRDLDGLLREFRTLKGKLGDIEAETIYNVEAPVIFTFGTVFKFFNFSSLTFGSRKGIDAVVEWDDKPLGLEFESHSSDFKRHKHRKQDCDLIVCWEKDDSPENMDVIELKQYWEEAQKTKV
jgi:hypothetical protein